MSFKDRIMPRKVIRSNLTEGKNSAYNTSINDDRVTDYVAEEYLDEIFKKHPIFGKYKGYEALDDMILSVATKEHGQFDKTYKVTKQDNRFYVQEIDEKGNKIGRRFLFFKFPDDVIDKTDKIDESIKLEAETKREDITDSYFEKLDKMRTEGMMDIRQTIMKTFPDIKVSDIVESKYSSPRIQLTCNGKKTYLYWLDHFGPTFTIGDKYNSYTGNKRQIIKYLKQNKNNIFGKIEERLIENKGNVTLSNLYSDMNRFGLDTEYREVFVQTAYDMGLDSKNNSEAEHRKAGKQVLSNEQVQEFLNRMCNTMKGDYQYDDFMLFVDPYLDKGNNEKKLNEVINTRLVDTNKLPYFKEEIEDRFDSDDYKSIWKKYVKSKTKKIRLNTYELDCVSDIYSDDENYKEIEKILYGNRINETKSKRIMEDDEIEIENTSEKDLEQIYKDFLTDEIKQYCYKDGKYEVYYDYRDGEAFAETIGKDLENWNPSTQTLDEFLFELVDEAFINGGSSPDDDLFDIINQDAKNKFEGTEDDDVYDYFQARISDFWDDMFECGYNGVDYDLPTLMSYIGKINVNITIAPYNETNYDMGSIIYSFGSDYQSPDLDYIDDTYLDNGITYLLHQQRHTVKELYDVLYGKVNAGKLVNSVAEEIKNNPAEATCGLTTLVSLSLEDYGNLLAAHKSGKGYIEVPQTTQLGLFNSWVGTGSTFEIELERPFVFPANMIMSIDVDSQGSSGNWSVGDVYGGIDRDEGITITNSAPQLVNEDLKATLQEVIDEYGNQQ